jgi:hypothetical protein
LEEENGEYFRTPAELAAIGSPELDVWCGSKAALRHVGFNVWFARKETSTAVIRVTRFMERTEITRP